MSLTAQDVFARDVQSLTVAERLRLASMILAEVSASIVEQSENWSDQDQQDVAAFSLEHANRLYPEDEELV